MTLFKSGLKIVSSIAAGAGITALTPIVVPALADKWKPIAKSAIKGGIRAYGIIKASTAGTVETLKDIAAEAKAEL
jgi:hypothetical protein